MVSIVSHDSGNLLHTNGMTASSIDSTANSMQRIEGQFLIIIQEWVAAKTAEITHQKREVLLALLSQTQAPHADRAVSSVLVQIEEMERKGHQPTLKEIQELTETAVLKQFTGESDDLVDPAA